MKYNGKILEFRKSLSLSHAHTHAHTRASTHTHTIFQDFSFARVSVVAIWISELHSDSFYSWLAAVISHKVISTIETINGRVTRHVRPRSYWEQKHIGLLFQKYLPFKLLARTVTSHSHHDPLFLSFQTFMRFKLPTVQLRSYFSPSQTLNDFPLPVKLST